MFLTNPVQPSEDWDTRSASTAILTRTARWEFGSFRTARQSRARLACRDLQRRCEKFQMLGKGETQLLDPAPPQDRINRRVQVVDLGR